MCVCMYVFPKYIVFELYNCKPLHSTYRMPGSHLITLHVPTHLILTTILQSSIHILQIRKLRPGEVKQFAQVHRDAKWQSWDLNPDSLASEPTFLPEMLSCLSDCWLFGQTSLHCLWHFTEPLLTLGEQTLCRNVEAH